MPLHEFFGGLSSLLKYLLRDSRLAILQNRRVEPESCDLIDVRIKSGFEWLRRSIVATNMKGSSKGYSYLKRWMPAYPETSGYIICAFIKYHKTYHDVVALESATGLADWLMTTHNDDGGISPIGQKPSPSFAFDTGMVLQGYTDLYKATADHKIGEYVHRCAKYLIDSQNEDGSWSNCYNYIPHAYHARVAWPLLDYAKTFSDKRALSKASANLDWVLAQQQENGYWGYAYFTPRLPYANTHSLGYILEGLLESYLLTKTERWLASAQKAADRLLSMGISHKGYLPGYINSHWQDQRVVPFPFACLTGIAQIARSWYLLYKITKDQRYKDAANWGIDFVCQYQDIDTDHPGISGGLPGSAPLFGRYLPFQFPNWATKFLVDGLLEKKLVTEKCGIYP